MALVRLDPFRELEALSRSILGRAQASRELDSFGDWVPAMDVQESDTEYLVKTDLPEVPKDQIKIGIENGVLTIEGERRQEKSDQTRHFHRLEREYGRFLRRLSVPGQVDEGRIAAEFKDGVLTVHLPKSPSARPKAVPIQVG